MKKVFRFILRAFLFLAMGFYILAGISSSLALYKIEMNRRQSIDSLSTIVRKAIAEDRLTDVSAWVQLRPLAETGELTATLTTESGFLAPDIFFELSRRQVQQGHIEEALFWSQLGRYRLRYDMLRCGRENSTGLLEKIMSLATAKEIEVLLSQHPELIKKSVRRVMDFDAKYPAQNSPSFVCGIVDKITRSVMPKVPKKEWASLRGRIRAATEQALKKMDGK